MPYIRQTLRTALDSLEATPSSAGELNYAISRLVNAYMRKFSDGQGPSYGAVNEVVGVLECAKLELYRRVAGPYEDEKLRENGDVFSILQER